MGREHDRLNVARNFIERYGADRFAWLLRCFQEGESGQVIADALDVSRERVRQWKNAFGTTVSFYDLHPEVEGMLREVRDAE